MHAYIHNAGMRWQKWAIYQRVMTKDMFQYSLEDYIFQNFLRDLDEKALSGGKDAVWKVISDEFRADQSAEVRSVMKAYYSAFNRQNYDDLGALWLPDENIELLLPGFSKAVGTIIPRHHPHSLPPPTLTVSFTQRGQYDVLKLYKKLTTKDAKPFGSVAANVVSVHCSGFIAVVKTIETVGAGTSLRMTPKRKGQGGKDKSSARVTSCLLPLMLLAYSNLYFVWYACVYRRLLQ